VVVVAFGWLLEAEADEHDELLSRLEESLLGVERCSIWCVGGLCELRAIESDMVGAIGECSAASKCGPSAVDDGVQGI
jgi:hypothetical protein